MERNFRRGTLSETVCSRHFVSGKNAPSVCTCVCVRARHSSSDIMVSLIGFVLLVIHWDSCRVTNRRGTRSPSAGTHRVRSHLSGRTRPLRAASKYNTLEKLKTSESPLTHIRALVDKPMAVFTKSFNSTDSPSPPMIFRDRERDKWRSADSQRLHPPDRHPLFMMSIKSPLCVPHFPPPVTLLNVSLCGDCLRTQWRR